MYFNKFLVYVFWNYLPVLEFSSYSKFIIIIIIIIIIIVIIEY